MSVAQVSCRIMAEGLGRGSNPGAILALNPNRAGLGIQCDRAKQGIAVGTGITDPGVFLVDLLGVALMAKVAAHPVIGGGIHVEAGDSACIRHHIEMRMAVDAQENLVGVFF